MNDWVGDEALYTKVGFVSFIHFTTRIALISISPQDSSSLKPFIGIQSLEVLQKGSYFQFSKFVHESKFCSYTKKYNTNSDSDSDSIFRISSLYIVINVCPWMCVYSAFLRLGFTFKWAERLLKDWLTNSISRSIPSSILLCFSP